MKYYLDTEFNGFMGELISLALVREDNESLYLIYPMPRFINGWVKEHVIPHLEAAHVWPIRVHGNAHRHLNSFFKGDDDIEIITDWPDDIQYLCHELLTGPGQMVDIPRIRFRMERVDAYPTKLEGAVQHNAWWDAMALKLCIEEYDRARLES